MKILSYLIKNVPKSNKNNLEVIYNIEPVPEIQAAEQFLSCFVLSSEGVRVLFTVLSLLQWA